MHETLLSFHCLSLWRQIKATSSLPHQRISTADYNMLYSVTSFYLAMFQSSRDGMQITYDHIIQSHCQTRGLSLSLVLLSRKNNTTSSHCQSEERTILPTPSFLPSCLPASARRGKRYRPGLFIYLSQAGWVKSKKSDGGEVENRNWYATASLGREEE